MSHFGTTPTTACDAVLDGLSVLQFDAGGAGEGGTGCVRTIKRYAGVRPELNAIDRHLTQGSPAFLVAYFGGNYEIASTHRQRFSHPMGISVICCAGKYDTYTARQAGDTPTVDPGLEDLEDWVVYYGCRALAGTSGLHAVRPVRCSLLRFQPEKYVSVVEIEATRQIDIYDDAPSNALEKLGIVHDPADTSELWEDPATDLLPDTDDWPRTVDGGVGDLDDYD